MNMSSCTTKYSQFSSPTYRKIQDQKFDWPPKRQRSHLVSFKSKIGVEYRRYSVARDNVTKFEDFFKKLLSMHQLFDTLFTVYYCDQDGEKLPINNDDNLAIAINSATCLETTHQLVAIDPRIQNYYPQKVIIEQPLLKLFLVKKGIPNDFSFTNKCKDKRRDNIINMLMSMNSSADSRPMIGMPEDFRQVSSIIDADILPMNRRRVVLKQGPSDKPLGFYIRDGTYQKMNSNGGIETMYGIFISRLVPGGLAESTNLLAKNDEILEVNGVDVGKKRLDQVRDMMLTNTHNLILTTRPAKPTKNRTRIYNGRDRLPSTQSNSSELGEDYIRHHIR